MRKAYKKIKETKMNTLIIGKTPKVKDSGEFMHFKGVTGQAYKKSYTMMSYIIMPRYELDLTTLLSKGEISKSSVFELGVQVLDVLE